MGNFFVRAVNVLFYCDDWAFDYWGKGTTVTVVTSGKFSTTPSLKSAVFQSLMSS